MLGGCCERDEAGERPINFMTTTDSNAGYKAWIGVALIPLSMFLSLVWSMQHYPLPWHLSLDWVPSLGISLTIRIDALSAQMAVLITGIGAMVLIYAVGYLDHEPRRARIFLLLPIFMLAMLGAVCADNIILFFAFWELTSITSFLLVGFNHQDASARDSARQALLITMGGGLALLGGLILLAQIAGTWSLSGIIASARALTDDSRLPWAILLVLTGAFTKSAQFPFHFWLPNAMSAPTPVSAYLHSATMVKLGIYLMARLDPAFNDLLIWEITLISIGTLTALWAAVLTLCERDLKRILARSTVSSLGMLTLLIGLPSPEAGLAVVAFLVAHALYKAPLFMVAGNIDHAVGTRVIDHLMGLRRVMPLSAAAAVLAGLSMAGLPMSFGYVAKDIIGVVKAESEVFIVVSYALFLVSSITIAVASIASIRVFWGPLEFSRDKIHGVSWMMALPPLAITLLGLEFEFFPRLIDPLLVPAATVISPGLSRVDLNVSYEFGEMMTAISLTLVIGLILFVYWDRLHDAISRMTWHKRFGPEAGYDLFLHGLVRIAAWHTRLLQSGRLDNYLSLSLGALLLMAGFVAWHAGLNLELTWQWATQAWAWLVACVLIAAGAVAAVLLRSRLAVLMASGMVGYGSALLFLFSGAPDLAFTQFSVETVLVVVAAAVLPHFAPAGTFTSSIRTPIKYVLAIVAGVITFLLLLHLQSFPENREMANWFGTASLLEAHGRNVVNVIIVDFRALDTLGEIAVVAFALLATLPLLKGMSGYPRSSSPITEMAALPLYWLMLAGALWILLRGHNAPGGGFIGGLVAVAASSQLAILRDTALARRLQLLPPLALSLSGIALALLSGFIGLVWGEGFLRHVWAGSLSSVMLFDFGVFCVVWGTLTGFIYSLLGETGESREIHTSSLRPET